MKDRYSVVARWEDTWFMDLPPNSKLLFSYICDRCDISGIIEWNTKVWSLHTGLKREQIIESMKFLESKLISDKKSKIWVKTHLYFQRYLPLTRGIEEHDWIISRLTSNFEKFGKPQEMLDILNNVVEKDKKSKKSDESASKFKAPSYEEFKEYYLSEDKTAEEDRIKDLFDHYLSCGWKVNNKPMKDWNAAVRNGIRRAKKGKQPTRTELALDVSQNFKVKK